MLRLYPEIGLWRISKTGELDQGDDGILWNPKARVLAVADGITGLEGKGHKDLKEFGRLLEMERQVSGPLLCFRRAFYDVLQNGGKSTFVGIEIPERDSSPARILHVGDSVCSRFRDGILELLTPEHTAWKEMTDRYPSILNMSQSLNSLSGSDLSLLAMMLEMAHERIFDEMVSLTSKAFDGDDAGELLSFRFHLRSFIQSLQCSIVADLGTSRNEVRSRVGEGVLSSVRMNDVFVLHTDGMNLPKEEVQHVLQTEPPARAARILVEKSTAPDDRAVGVVRLSDTPSKKSSGKIVRKSIQEF